MVIPYPLFSSEGFQSFKIGFFQMKVTIMGQTVHNFSKISLNDQVDGGGGVLPSNVLLGL